MIFRYNVVFIYGNGINSPFLEGVDFFLPWQKKDQGSVVRQGTMPLPRKSPAVDLPTLPRHHFVPPLIWIKVLGAKFPFLWKGWQAKPDGVVLGDDRRCFFE